MAAQRLDGHRREVDGTATTRALRRWPLPGGSPVLWEVERMLHAEGASLQVYIVPAEGEELALAHAGGKRQDIERLQRVILGGLEQPFRLLGRQRLHLPTGGSGSGDQTGDVARDGSEALGVVEGGVKHGVNVGDAGGGETFGALGAVEGLHLHGSEFGEANPAKSGDDVMADIQFVAVPGARLHHWRALRLQPLYEEAGERLAVIGRGIDAFVALGGGLGHFPGDLAARLAEEGLAASVREADTRLVASVGALADTAFTIATAARAFGVYFVCHRLHPFDARCQRAMRG